MSMKNSNDIIRNRTHDLPVSSSVPQPTAAPYAPSYIQRVNKMHQRSIHNKFPKQDGNACSKRTCSCSQTPLTGSKSTHTLTIRIIHSILSCNCLPYSRKHNNSRVTDDSTGSAMLGPDQSRTKNNSL